MFKVNVDQPLDLPAVEGAKPPPPVRGGY